MRSIKHSIVAAALLLLAAPAMAVQVFYAPFDTNFNDAAGGRTGVSVNGASLTGPAAPHGGTASANFTAAGNDAVTFDIMGADAVSGTYTIGMWVRGTTDTGATGTFFGTRSGSDQSFDVKFQGGATIHGDIGTGSAWLDTSADSTIFDYLANQWHHVAYVVTPTGYTLYGNGFQLASESFGPAVPLLFDATHDIAVGAVSTGLGENFTGFVDEVKIHNTALTAAQVRQLAAMDGAQPITTIFSTGLDAGGTVLPDGTIGDPHWTLVSVPGGTSSIRVSSSAGGFPIGPWLGDNADSRWIGPNNDADMNGPAGNYTYETTFSLAGLDPNTAFLMGLWASDNPGVDIVLNGVSVGAGQLAVDIAGSNSFAHWTPFVLDAATLPPGTFVAGLNTLQFIVNNGGGPTGLRVEVTGFAKNAIPEPACLALVSLAGAALLRRRRAA
jgi:hypothetical protein